MNFLIDENIQYKISTVYVYKANFIQVVVTNNIDESKFL